MPSENLGPSINTKTRDFCPYFSPDGRYFFYSSDGNVKWVKNSLKYKLLFPRRSNDGDTNSHDTMEYLR
ncbi:hypothetical protein F0L74_15165 [Chitinophaga agrisoli]|uniref:WD40 repeat protein n=1 Tax=Chitinophaga agrisoli TaxID=2607653 RepID=A0A5B2VZ18_9BACT|nr:hypothetical protein F0L74_15165 [Chitinophaga agrisoli]